MIELTISQAVAALLVAIGVLLHFLAMYEAARSVRPLPELPAGKQGGPDAAVPFKSMTPKREAEINAAFEALVARKQPMEHEPVYEIPIEHIRPGDLLKTVKMPPFVQSHKKRPQQTMARA
jgi:hypothetical protein